MIATLLATATAAAAAALPGWPPAHLDLGLASRPGGAAQARALHVRYRYHYLAGGVDTGNGWSTWNPQGTFVSRYVRESRAAGRTPVLTYYQLLQSAPQRHGGESDKDLGNLADPEVMRAYYADLALALRRAREAAAGKLVILHIEPDLWGYIEQQAGDSDDARTVPAAVASTGDPRLAGLPDNAAGFAQAILRLRDKLAPRVALAYHLSTWGTGVDPVVQNPGPDATQQLARRSARFYTSLGARFNVIFTDPSDRDDGFKRKILGDKAGRGRWTSGDYARDVRWLGVVHRATQRPIVLWQIPLGNRHLPNTWGRFRDTHVETLLGDRHVLRAYRDAGVVALLFGGGADGTTSERTDGGVFGRLAAGYVRRGPLRTAG